MGLLVCLSITSHMHWGSEIHFNSLNTELNPICYLLALLGAHHIFHVSGLRVNMHPIKTVLSIWKSKDFLSYSRNFLHFVAPQVFYHIKWPAICPCSEPNKSSPPLPILYYRLILTFLPVYF